MDPTCPACHIAIRATDYYCFNCGKNLRPAPLPTTWQKQLEIYLGSLLLPPLGIVWGVRYLREKDKQAQIVGAIAIVVTVVTLVVVTKVSIDLFNNLNNQINSQIQNLQGF
ncbi:hypothetical protein C4564_05465 [Candidatus Microgenomates bacterium]|nr:MAG: hypothetical protein C4564_05465 [Candidatus Microgenomates bacterium]